MTACLDMTDESYRRNAAKVADVLGYTDKVDSDTYYDSMKLRYIEYIFRELHLIIKSVDKVCHEDNQYYIERSCQAESRRVETLKSDFKALFSVENKLNKNNLIY